jgi:SH3-like domain-containing protein
MIKKQKWFPLLFFCFISSFAYADFMSVNVDQAFLHEAPSDSTKKSYIVTKGYPLEVIVSLKEWKKVKDHVGLINWIKTSDLSSKRTVLNLKNNNSIYLEPLSESPLLANVNENVTLELLDEKKIDGWVKVYSKFGDIEGFIKDTDLWGIK